MPQVPSPNQAWFEMADLRKRTLSTAVWIPLLSSQTLVREGSHGYDGFVEEFFGVGSVMFSATERAAAEKLTWSDIGLAHDNRGWAEDDRYVPAHAFASYSGLKGEYPVLKQFFNGTDGSEWHLGQDLVTTLGLKREGDCWVRPAEGYVEVARLSRDAKGSPALLQIRASHLRDYLAARNMGLYVTSYRSRTSIRESREHVNWPEEELTDNEPGNEWSGRIMAIHEGGFRFGEETAVFHISRTDIDPDDDVPSMALPGDDNVRTSSWKRGSNARKVFRIMGELWKNEWVAPAASSPIVRGDEVAPTVYFVTDAVGTQESRSTLVEGPGRWLWFRPEVMMEIAHRRGGSMVWYTRDTGGISGSAGYAVHFGVNDLGFINVYAKDIGLLPDWQQKIWAGYNVPPEGKVSRELLMSQVEAVPATTQAAEAFFASGLELLGEVSKRVHGESFLRQHENLKDIASRVHRFRSITSEGLFALAKDVARLTADSLDIGAMQRAAVPPPNGTKLGSLKSLQGVVASKIGEESARAIMGPLFHVYELRLADAHMPGEGIQGALAGLGISTDMPAVFQGRLLLEACVTSIYGICEALAVN